VEISSREELEFQVHKCFGRIFELLGTIDATVTQEAEKEMVRGNQAVLGDVRDQLEEVILQCHLAWQYHRLSRMFSGSTAKHWDRLENDGKSQPEESE
jgi:hypothetical protein